MARYKGSRAPQEQRFVSGHCFRAVRNFEFKNGTQKERPGANHRGVPTQSAVRNRLQCRSIAVVDEYRQFLSRASSDHTRLIITIYFF